MKLIRGFVPFQRQEGLIFFTFFWKLPHLFTFSIFFQQFSFIVYKNFKEKKNGTSSLRILEMINCSFFILNYLSFFMTSRLSNDNYIDSGKMIKVLVCFFCRIKRKWINLSFEKLWKKKTIIFFETYQKKFFDYQGWRIRIFWHIS